MRQIQKIVPYMGFDSRLWIGILGLIRRSASIDLERRLVNFLRKKEWISFASAGL